jgi:hypothetical protein
MSKTTIDTPKYLNWNVGEGNRFKNLGELLDACKGVRKLGFPGWAGGPILTEIALVEEMMCNKEFRHLCFGKPYDDETCTDKDHPNKQQGDVE